MSARNALEYCVNIAKSPELRKKILFTLCALAIYRIGASIVLPGVNPTAWEGGVLGWLALLSGASLSHVSLFSLGLAPYITASIIMQVLIKFSPYLASLAKEGDLGRRTINRFTMGLTVLICLGQALALAFTFEQKAAGMQPVIYQAGWGPRLLITLTATAGSLFLVWLGEQITQRGIGNGTSLIIFTGILADLPKAIHALGMKINYGEWSVLTMAVITGLMALVAAIVVRVEKGQRRVPIQSARRMAGQHDFSTKSSYLPLKLNPAGVLPIIFAASVLAVLQVLVSPFHAPWVQGLGEQLRPGYLLYEIISSLAIMSFTYMSVGIVAHPDDMADHLKKAGAYIPGIRPGRPTARYLERILSRLVFWGGLYLAMLSALPNFLTSGFKVQSIPFVGTGLEALLPKFITSGLGLPFYFGGTSLLIVIGVAIELMQQMEAHLIMEQYETFSLSRGKKRRR